jgi:hypothetical protein
MALANNSSVRHGHRRQIAPLEETFAAGKYFSGLFKSHAFLPKGRRENIPFAVRLK